MKICLVTAVHIQPTKEWIDSLPNCDVIIIDDSNGKVKIDLPNVRMYDYAKQKELLGDLYDEFDKRFHKSSACKNLGHLIAYKEGYDVMIEIDSDCVCPSNLLYEHLKSLNSKGGSWENPLYKVDRYPRGYPYWARDKEVIANLGLWSDCLDINGADRTIDEPMDSLITDNKVSVGMIPFSGMNFAIKREWIPCMFLVPNFGEFRRHDDIFGGYILQKIVKMCDKCVTYGLPIVRHDSVVVPEEDAEAEKEMNQYDYAFYKIIDKAFEKVSGSSPLDIVMNLEFDCSEKFKEFGESFNYWKKCLKIKMEKIGE